jgi:hypothetical protein
MARTELAFHTAAEGAHDELPVRRFISISTLARMHDCSVPAVRRLMKNVIGFPPAHRFPGSLRFWLPDALAYLEAVRAGSVELRSAEKQEQMRARAAHAAATKKHLHREHEAPMLAAQ